MQTDSPNVVNIKVNSQSLAGAERDYRDALDQLLEAVKVKPRCAQFATRGLSFLCRL